MADMQRLVVSDLLCYSIKKFARVPIKPLKSVINDFYSADDICEAKDKLIEEVDQLNLDKWQRPARRRKDSITRTQNEIDDIFNIIIMLDESLNIQRLPIFVSTDPDRMPSIKLSEGDLSCLLIKLNSIEMSVTALTEDVMKLPTKLVSDNAHGKGRRVMFSAQGPQTGERVGGAAGADSAEGPGKNSSALSSNVLHQASKSTGSGLSSPTSSDAEETSDNEGFSVVGLRKRKKRKQSVSPNGDSTSLQVGSSYSSKAATPKATPARSANRVNSKPREIIGASSSSVLKASNTLIVKKAVYRLGNIDSSYAPNDVIEHVRSLGVRILTCFDLKQSSAQPDDNKAFRICIVAEDKQKLCDSDNWSVGVSLREWVHKPKKAAVLHDNMDVSNAGASSVTGNSDPTSIFLEGESATNLACKSLDSIRNG
jgi:hypothetical protein